MLAVARYLLADLLRSQYFLAPLLLYLAALAVLFGGDPGAPPGPWAASALVLCPVSVWLTMTVVHCEDPVQRSVTVAAVGGWGRLLAGVLGVCVLGDLLLVAVSVLWPVLKGPYPYGAETVALGVLAHLACALTGTAVGLLCARPVVTRPGWSVCLASALVLVAVVQPQLPPVGSTVAALGGTVAAPMRVVTVAVVLAVVLLGAAATVHLVVARRR
ncbi:MAG TPA: hypothetical protein VIL00_04650 [Pseudonocardiaceae bacterium]